MNKKPLVLFILSAIGAGVGYVFTNSIDFGLCQSEQYGCRDLYNQVGDPLFFGMIALAVVFLILTFVPKAWEAWKKFAIWFVPLATLLFIFYKNPGSGDLVSPYAETVFVWVSGAYVLVSLAIISLATFGKRGS